MEKEKSPPEHLSLSDEYKQVKWVMGRVTKGKHLALANVRLGRDLDSDKEIESKLCATEHGELDLKVVWRDHDVIPCKLSFVRLHDLPLGLLLGVQVVGPTQKRGQNQLF